MKYHTNLHHDIVSAIPVLFPDFDLFLWSVEHDLVSLPTALSSISQRLKHLLWWNLIKAYDMVVSQQHQLGVMKLTLKSPIMTAADDSL